MAVFFNGQKYISPAVMSRVDDTAMTPVNIAGENTAVFIGRSEGGEPKKPIVFDSASEARRILRKGDLLDAVEQSFDPSVETDTPIRVIAVRVNPATQASDEIANDSGSTVIRLKSKDFGRYTNSIKYKIESGTEVGKKITAQIGDDYYVDDNVGRGAFTVEYEGEQATATISITNTTVILAAGSDTTEIDLNDFDTVVKLVDRINSVAGFTADALDGNSEIKALNALDAVTSANVKTAYTARADLQAVVDWFNGITDGLITAERVENAGSVPKNISWQFLTGGTDGNVTTQDWQDCFDMLQGVDAQWFTPLTSEPAIHAMCEAHCAFMSTTGRKERRCIVGGPLGATDAQAIAAAKALNSDRLSYVHLGMYAYDENGKLKLYAPYILAAKIAGMFSGVTPGYSLTNKTVKIAGIERNLRNPSDTDALLVGGVIPIENRDKGFTITQSITTWRGSDKYNRREVSTGAAVDYVVRNVRDRIEDLIGGEPGSPQKLSLAVETADTALRQLANEGIIVGDAENPAYRNLTATLDGDFLKMECEISPGVPVNYISITVHCVPYSGTARA